MDYVLWIDSDKAQIFGLGTSGIEKSHMKKSGMDHHTHSKKDSSTDANEEHFFRDLSTKLSDANELLIFGPGLAKNRFKTHLDSHHAGTLGKKVIGLENSDHPTDNQILAEARKFFKHYDLFNT